MKKRKKPWTPKHEDRFRNTPEYKLVRKKVLQRDNYKCQYPGCKCRGKRMQVHHIMKYSSAFHLRANERNLITLCFTHHKGISKLEHNYITLFSEIVRRKYEN